MDRIFLKKVLPAPKSPKPPEADTAAVSSAVEANAIGAARMGVLMSGVKVISSCVMKVGTCGKHTEKFGEASVDGLHVGESG